MSESDRRSRLYDEKEVGKLLERATQIQRDESVRVVRSGGLSLRELEEIADEAGIDPRHLRRAALELDSGASGSSAVTRFLGSAPSLVVEASVPGELPVEDFEHLVPVIRQASRVAGQPSQVGRTLTWHAELEMGRRDRSLIVTVSVRDGETWIRAEEQLGPVALAVFAGGMGGIGMGLGVGLGAGIGIDVLGSVLFAVAFPFGVVGLAYLGAREIFRRFSRSRRRILADVVDRLAGEISARIAAASPEGGPAPKELPGS